MTTAPTAPTAPAPAAPKAQARTITRTADRGSARTGTVQLRLHNGDEGWFNVCDRALLTPGRGVAVLLPNGRQAALFQDRSGSLHALDNRDPFTGASVLSRGLLGSVASTPFVASPLLKQRFALTDGRCLDDDGVAVTVYEVRVVALGVRSDDGVQLTGTRVG